MIFPLATKSAYGIDASNSRESVHNCYVEINEAESETEVSIRFREGLHRHEEVVTSPYSFIAAKLGMRGKTYVAVTKDSLNVYMLSNGRLSTSYKFNPPLENSFLGAGAVAEVRDGHYVVANLGKLVYVDNIWGSKYTESFLEGSSSVAMLRGYLVVAVGEKLYVSDFQEPKVFRPLSYLHVGFITLSMVEFNDQLWVFSADGIQVYTLSGGTVVPLAPVVGSHYEYDIKEPHPVVQDEKLFFIDAHYNIYQVQGYSFVRITPPGIKKLISREGGLKPQISAPRLFVDRIPHRNFPSLCVTYNSGAGLACMNLDNGLWRTESFNGTVEGDDLPGASSEVEEGKVVKIRQVITGVANALIMTDGTYRRSNQYVNDDGRPIRYRLESPQFHRERALTQIRMIGFNFGATHGVGLPYPVSIRMRVHKASRQSAIERTFIANNSEDQRNRQYNLGSSRSMSVELDVDTEGVGIPIGGLVLSGAEVE